MPATTLAPKKASTRTSTRGRRGRRPVSDAKKAERKAWSDGMKARLAEFEAEHADELDEMEDLFGGRYSLQNTLLILMQYPTATDVHGYDQWLKDHGRQVRRDEKAIYIRRVIEVGKAAAGGAVDDEVEKQPDGSFKRCIWLRVFDRSQTIPAES